MADQRAPGSDCVPSHDTGHRGDPRPGRRSRALSTLLQRSILLGAALAMVLFGAPLAVAVKGLYRAQAFANLAGDAEMAHAEIIAGLTAGRQPGAGTVTVNLPTPHTEHASLGLYDDHGARRGGSGPAQAEWLVREAWDRRVEGEGVVGDQAVVAVPVAMEDDGRTWVVRAAAPLAEVRARTYASWAVMAGLGGIVLVVVAGLGRAHARRVARPLQSLAAAADALGHGDFSIRAVHAGVAEIDAVSHNLERTARRLGGMLERERSFSADSSHQLRAPLTAVRIGLESALLTPEADLRAAVEETLVGLDRLEQTVLDLLALARDTSGPRQHTDVGALVGDVAGYWARALADQARGLQVDLEPDLPAVAVSQPALRTVLDVLLGNALTHGAGRVSVLVRATEATVLVQVDDEGTGVTGDPARIFARRSAEAQGTGIGLALARSLAEADGGRLELTRAVPARFALVLPAAANVPGSAPSPGQDDRWDGGVNGTGRENQRVRPGITRPGGS
jgi:signal transduction histidine kinase